MFTIQELNEYVGYLWTTLKILSAPALLRAYIYVQSLRMYGVYTLYKKREKIIKHNIFVILDSLYTDEELFYQISDTARRELFKDIFRIEVYGMNEIAIAFIDFIYVHKTFLSFMRYHKYLDTSQIVEFFLKMYNAHRDKLERKFYQKMLRAGLSKEKAVYIIQRYYEFTKQNSDILRSNLESLRDRENLYFGVMDILNNVKVYIVSQKIFLPIHFANLNGKLNNLSYKSYISETESKPKISGVVD